MPIRVILFIIVLSLLPRFEAFAADDSIISFSSNPHAVEAVDRQLGQFSVNIRERFAIYLSRSGKYLELMKSILKAKGMPEELAYLALIESGFNTHACSRSKAVGPWQFMSFTGKKYGLKIDWWVDERRDPVKSTEAAANYLNDLHDMFGSWDLAIAAYNAGEGRISRALRKVNGEDFWSLQTTRHIKRETRNYVPKFIAARIIAENPEFYGFSDISYEDSISYEIVELENPVDIDVAAECAGTTVDVIRELNPELKRWCTPPNAGRYLLRVPEGTGVSFFEKLDQMPETEQFSISMYKVKKGDTLYDISRATGIPIHYITELNSIKRRSYLHIGQILYIPSKGNHKLTPKELETLKAKLNRIGRTAALKSYLTAENRCG